MAKPRKKANRKADRSEESPLRGLQTGAGQTAGRGWSKGKPIEARSPLKGKATRQTFEERQRKAIKAIAAKWAKQPRQRGL